jgi:lactate dehydrogenase-like 2-hydroxyacid dehydrogenase
MGLSEVTAVSEYVFWAILHWCRPMNAIGSKLKYKTIGIIGNGRIGKHVAKRAAGFDMTVLIYERDHEKYSIYGSSVPLKEVLEKSDFVTIHIPEGADNNNFFDDKLFNLMKTGSYLINTSRASVLNLADLIASINKKHIAGAMLDTWEEKDLLACRDRPDTLMLTNHVAGWTLEDRIYTDKIILEQVQNYIDDYPFCRAV